MFCWHCRHTMLSTHTHTRLTALFPGLPRWAGTRTVKPIWILLKQETVSGSGISWAICKSAPCCRQTTTPAAHHSVFYRPDALRAAQPTASKHWRLYTMLIVVYEMVRCPSVCMTVYPIIETAMACGRFAAEHCAGRRYQLASASARRRAAMAPQHELTIFVSWVVPFSDLKLLVGLQQRQASWLLILQYWCGF